MNEFLADEEIKSYISDLCKATNQRGFLGADMGYLFGKIINITGVYDSLSIRVLHDTALACFDYNPATQEYFLKNNDDFVSNGKNILTANNLYEIADFYNEYKLL